MERSRAAFSDTERDLMPIRIKIDPNERTLTCHYMGKVTDEELLRAWKKTYEDDAWSPGMPELIDLSKLDDTRVTTAGMQRLIEYCRSVYRREGLDKVRVSVYAPQPLLGLGLLRMYQSISENSAETISIFSDYGEARAFLTEAH